MSATEKPKSPPTWRDVIKIHPAANMLPRMSPDELKALGEDIQTNGLLNRITLFVPKECSEDFESALEKKQWAQRLDLVYLLDGCNRLDALECQGVKVVDESGSLNPALITGHVEIVFEDWQHPDAKDTFDPYGHVISRNLRRRHITNEQKREFIAKMLKTEPSRSNRAIGGQIKVDHKTVGAVRDKLETRGEIPHVSTVEDTKGRLQPTHKKAKQQEKAERRATREAELAAKITALPSKKYGVVYADPPWRFEPYSRNTGMDRAADNHYPTCATDEIAALPVPAIAADDAVCFLWATAPMIDAALAVMQAWGFEYKSQVVWDKEIAGTGYWFRNQHELLLVGTRGNVPAPAPGMQWPSVIRAPRRAHSEKPERALELIEDYFPTLPKIELYGRGESRLGWDAWGNEAMSPVPASSSGTPEYDPGKDMTGSINECYQAIRERMAAGDGFDPDRKPSDRVE